MSGGDGGLTVDDDGVDRGDLAGADQAVVADVDRIHGNLGLGA